MEKFNTEIINKYSEFFRALSHPVRLEMALVLLESKEGMNVSEIQAQVKVSQSSVSQHLRILKQAGLLSSNRSGTMVVYNYGSEEAKNIVEYIKTLKK
ncbi:MAG: metalloregulator ArsR/SmtB family transcription factor [Tissierellia bacterium]|nr:metalloregulator ArsR/SmtB family transcription factor [Tissierellia bacterium]